jgi:DNA-binding NtrC family response regulator
MEVVMGVTKKSRIMIVDDDPEVLMLLETFLQNEGFGTVTAESGAEAIRKCAAERPGLALIDIAMPVMDGLATLQELKKLDAGLPAIMITGYRDAEKVTAAFRSGAFDCIFKPFDFDYLRLSIKSKLLE